MSTTQTTDQDWSEARLQAECHQWHWNEDEFKPFRRLLFTVNNNAHNRIKGAINKAVGVVPGVSDMVYLAFGVHCIELKKPGERQSPEQRDFQAKATAQGHQYHLVRSLEEFKQLIYSIHQNG